MRRARMLAVSVVLVAACAGDPVRLGSSLPEDRTVDFTRGRPVYAQATGMQVLWFVPISINDRHARAWDSLQRRAPNHYITDVRIEEIWTWGFIGTFYTTQLQATAYPYVDEP